MPSARIGLAAASTFFLITGLKGQETPLAWDAAPSFRYNILSATFNPTTRKVTVVGNVTNPLTPAALPYDVFDPVAPTFKSPATLRVLVGWNAGSGATELVNTGSLPAGPSLNSVIRGWMNVSPPALGATSPAGPTSINVLTAGVLCSAAGSACGPVAFPSRTWQVSATLPPQAKGLGRVAIEGHPVKVVGTSATGAAVLANIPVKSAFADFAIDSSASARRKVVEFANCAKCHDGLVHGKGVVPRLSLHGANRNEELGTCVICHNPNQTDASYRSAGAEQSVDFKQLIHGIHGNKKRSSPLVVVGFRGTIVDYGHVKFPGEVRNCLYCHVESGGKGTYEVPSNTGLGSTTKTGSVVSPLPGLVDVDPSNNLRMSPVASACSGCHDSSEDRSHMVRNGASFNQTQELLTGKERCVNCHGAGREKDVRRVHEVSARIESVSDGDDESEQREEERKPKKDKTKEKD